MVLQFGIEILDTNNYVPKTRQNLKQNQCFLMQNCMLKSKNIKNKNRKINEDVMLKLKKLKVKSDGE